MNYLISINNSHGFKDYLIPFRAVQCHPTNPTKNTQSALLARST